MGKITKRTLNEQLENTFTGIWIPKGIWLCDELTPIQMLVLMQIHSLDGKFGCKVSNQHIADFFGVHLVTISDHIKTLNEKKFIDIEYQNNNPSLGNRVIKCSRKFKLIIADLADDIEEYKQTLQGKENTKGGKENTKGGKENTNDRITLEEHKKITNINISNKHIKETKVSTSKFDCKSELQSEIYNTLNDKIKEKFITWFTKKTGKKTIESFKLSINQILQATEDQANWLLDTALEKQITGNGWQGIKLEYLPYKLKNQVKPIQPTNKIIKVGIGETYASEWELEILEEEEKDTIVQFLQTHYIETTNQNLIKFNQLIN
jgi:hypothetical protein